MGQTGEACSDTEELLGFGVDQRIFWAAGFTEAGFTFAGITGFCGMAKLLALMPWNKTGSAREYSISG